MLISFVLYAKITFSYCHFFRFNFFKFSACGQLIKTREFSAKKWYKMKTTVSHLKEKSL